MDFYQLPERNNVHKKGGGNANRIHTIKLVKVGFLWVTL